MKTSPTRAGLSLVLLLYFLGVILVITLAPFRFAMPVEPSVMTYGETFDVVANVLLFVPLGFLYPLSVSPEREPSPLRVFVIGLCLSGAIEATQLFEPGRFPSLVDVITNASGAGLGALVVRVMTRRIRVNARMVGRLSLEIPLIGLVYLLVPLLVVASLSAVEQRVRLVALVPLGLVGARLLSSVYRNHFGRTGVLDVRDVTAVAVGWMVLGTFPVLPRYPAIGAALVALVGLTTWYETSRVEASALTAERRFEAEALRSATPYIAVYFLCVILLPLALGIETWRFELGLTGSRDNIAQQQLRLLEPVASLTALGYLLAEARGRVDRTFQALAVRATLECAAVAILIEVSRGFQRDVGASGVQLVLMTASGFLGAAIYYSQREHVQWIVAHRADVGAIRRPDVSS